MTTTHKDMPPLPIATINHDGPVSGASEWFSADQMRDYARAALAAQNQPEVSSKADSHPSLSGEAEPVYQVRSMISPEAWCDISKNHAVFCETYGYGLRTLYRAAPPQQVETSGLPG
jgi:hypothetical protein